MGKRRDIVLAGDFNRHDQLWGGDDVTGRRQGQSRIDRGTVQCLLPTATDIHRRRRSATAAQRSDHAEPNDGGGGREGDGSQGLEGARPRWAAGNGVEAVVAGGEGAGFAPVSDITGYRTIAHVEADLASINIGFDVKGAYNGVFKDRLLQRLEARGISKRLIRWTDAFYSNRMATITVNGYTSALRDLPQAGLPQGSPLSPILFLFFNADLVQSKIDSNGGSIAFIDDYSAWVTGPTAEDNREGIQSIIDRALA
ncbi:hypothetical protein FCOIX_8766 [Fusarium coicis]|nr:hypothetical protein FCOIX_8766 [Fusarium coicis]